jgi:hypothetical protein
MDKTPVETIHHKGFTLAIIIRFSYEPPETAFLTDGECSQQVGFVVHPQGHEIERHVHAPHPRVISDFTEVIFVKRGKMLTDIYDPEKNLVTTREIRTGDLLILFFGGHRFRMLEDTILLEVKQGPEAQSVMKEFF